MKFFHTLALTAALLSAPVTTYAKDTLKGPAVVEVADISVGLNGLVCDFCSIALNKTFKKRTEVRGTYVDLDTKVLSVALNDGQDLDNATIMKLVKDAGYNVTKISRKDGREYVPESKTKS